MRSELAGEWVNLASIFRQGCWGIRGSGLRKRGKAGMDLGVTRDLIANPAWQDEDLGHPLPDSIHACSVSLPTWDSVIGYEENREKVRKRLRAGYPRFFRHAAIERLNDTIRAESASDEESVVVLPTRASVQRAQRWVERRAETAVRVTSCLGLHALLGPAKVRDEAELYRRFSGEVVSSRQAQDALDGALREGSKSHLVARAIASFEGVSADDVFIVSSGMAAVTAAMRALPGLRDGKKTLQIEFPYVDSLKTQEQLGNGVVYLNRAEGEPFDEALLRIRQGEFAGVFTEVPGNPLLRTIDLARVAEACNEGGTPLLVDHSATGPLNVDVLRYADVITSSLTKWVSGEGDVMAGSIVLRADSSHAEWLRDSLSEAASDVAPLYIADAEVLLSNLADYSKRNRLINDTAMQLAAWLAQHPAVAEVWHPSLTTRAAYDALRRKQGGYGGLISFVLKNPKKTPKVYDMLRLCKGPSFGTPFTLVCAYPMLAHYHELDWAESCGIPPHLLRISCGLEPLDHLINVFGQALEG